MVWISILLVCGIILAANGQFDPWMAQLDDQWRPTGSDFNSDRSDRFSNDLNDRRRPMGMQSSVGRPPEPRLTDNIDRTTNSLLGSIGSAPPTLPGRLDREVNSLLGGVPPQKLDDASSNMLIRRNDADDRRARILAGRGGSSFVDDLPKPDDRRSDSDLSLRMGSGRPAVDERMAVVSASRDLLGGGVPISDPTLFGKRDTLRDILDTVNDVVSTKRDRSLNVIDRRRASLIADQLDRRADIVDGVKDTLSDVADNHQDRVSDVVDNVQDVTSDISDRIGDRIENRLDIVETRREVASDIVDNIGDGLESVADRVSDRRDSMGDIIDNVVDARQDVVDNLVDRVDDRIDRRLDARDDRIDYTADVVDDRIDRRNDIIDDTIDRRKDIIDDRIDRRKDVIDDRIDRRNDIIDDRIDRRKDIIDDRIDRQRDIIDDIIDRRKDIIGDRRDALQDRVENVVDIYEDRNDWLQEAVERELDRYNDRYDRDRYDFDFGDTFDFWDNYQDSDERRLNPNSVLNLAYRFGKTSKRTSRSYLRSPRRGSLGRRKPKTKKVSFPSNINLSKYNWYPKRFPNDLEKRVKTVRKQITATLKEGLRKSQRISKLKRTSDDINDDSRDVRINMVVNGSRRRISPPARRIDRRRRVDLRRRRPSPRPRLRRPPSPGRRPIPRDGRRGLLRPTIGRIPGARPPGFPFPGPRGPPYVGPPSPPFGRPFAPVPGAMRFGPPLIPF